MNYGGNSALAPSSNRTHGNRIPQRRNVLTRPNVVQPLADCTAGLDEFGAGRVADVGEADLEVLSVPEAASRRRVGILKPMAADDVWVHAARGDILGECRNPFAIHLTGGGAHQGRVIFQTG